MAKRYFRTKSLAKKLQDAKSKKYKKVRLWSTSQFWQKQKGNANKKWLVEWFEYNKKQIGMAKKTIYWIVGIILFLWYYSCRLSIKECRDTSMFGGICKIPVKLSGCIPTNLNEEIN